MTKGKMNLLEHVKASQKQKHSGSNAIYNVRTDPDLGFGKAAVRRIPCACDACLKQLEEPWITLKNTADVQL